MKPIYQILATALCAVCAVTANASEFNYNYVQVSYIKSDLDLGSTDVDSDILALSGSFPITNNAFFSASFQTGDYDFDLDTDLFAIGGGYHTPVSPKIDIVLSAHYLDAQVKVASLGRADDTGHSVDAILRFASTPKVEIYGGVGYVDLYGSSDAVIGLGARVKFGGDRSFGVGYAKSDDASDISLSFRMEM